MEEAEGEGLLKDPGMAGHRVLSVMGQRWLECHHGNSSLCISCNSIGPTQCWHWADPPETEGVARRSETE